MMTETDIAERDPHPPIARLVRVVKRFGGLIALDDVSLMVRPGERLALVGHNGSGKSTMMKLLLGFLHPDGGAVEVMGRIPDHPNGARMRGRLAYLPERVAFDPQMTGRELLVFYSRLKGVPTDHRTIDKLLAEVGLQAAADRRIYGYSKGMQQRLGIAQALIGDADLYLFDEPTTGLDPIARRHFFRLVDRLREKGAAVIIASHVLAELESVADRVAMISNGRLFAVGTLADLRAESGLARRLVLLVAPGALLRVERVFAGIAREMRVTGGERLEILFDDRARQAVLRALAGLGAEDVRDFSFHAPGLDDLYAHL
ncbi:MAG: ABC transporter ATP-binding protein, partial [Alphaproteobacteria bacterium]